MAFETPTISYNGSIKEVPLGNEASPIIVGGETCYPFHAFEGANPHHPLIAMDVYDVAPEEWPEAIVKVFADVLNDPAAWAKKCVATYGADIIALQLAGTDPNGHNRSAEEATAVTKKVLDAVSVPVLVWGSGNLEKDTEVLRAVAEGCSDVNLIIGPVEEGSHKSLGAAAIAYKHKVAASTPIDINLAKQLNILLANLGVTDEQILIDPTVSSLGYGLEYCYSVMERIRMAALTQEDERLQFPIACNLAKEVWKIKETRLSEEENPTLGNAEKRGILLEAMTAMLCLLSGGDILVMRHPEAISLIREMVNDLNTSG